MEAASQRSAPWSTTQAYIIALCCLLLGAIVGYLFRSPGGAPAAASMVAAGHAAPADMPPAGQSPTPGQMKHMADKQSEPLLARLKADPDNPELLSQIAGFYYAAHQFPLAVQYYQRAVAVKPTAKVLTSLGNAYFNVQDPDKALDSFQRALALDPGFADALFNLGLVKWQAKEDPKGAVDAWQKLLKANPTHPRRAQVEEMIARARKHIGRAPAPPAR